MSNKTKLSWQEIAPVLKELGIEKFKHVKSSQLLWLSPSPEQIEQLNKKGIFLNKNNAYGHFSHWVRTSHKDSFFD